MKWISIGSGNGLSPARCQAIIWTNAELLSIGPLGTNFSQIVIVIQTFSFKKMSSAKWWPFCLGEDESNSSLSHSGKWAIRNTVPCCCHLVKIPHKIQSIACPLYQAMGCILWVRTLIYTLPQSPQLYMWYHVILYHIIMALVCILEKVHPVVMRLNCNYDDNDDQNLAISHQEFPILTPAHNAIISLPIVPILSTLWQCSRGLHLTFFTLTTAIFLKLRANPVGTRHCQQ